MHTITRISLSLPCLVVICLTIMSASGAAITFKSSEERVSLIELYTSEGCSSCPPAETWLGRLKTSPGLWKNFVPVAFHVDYWDYLGWRDPWSKSEFSDRQRDYAAHWHSGSIYTPGFVLDGREWRNWSGQKDGPKMSGVKVGELTVTSPDTNRWQVNFAATNNAGASYEVHAALLAGGLTSDVKAGENRGRRLSHDFTVLTLVQAPLIRRDGSAQGDFLLPLRRSDGGDLAIAVWVTRAGSLEPLQATGGWLVRNPVDR